MAKLVIEGCKQVIVNKLIRVGFTGLIEHWRGWAITLLFDPNHHNGYDGNTGQRFLHQNHLFLCQLRAGIS
jgi:hypothetical protein